MRSSFSWSFCGVLSSVVAAPLLAACTGTPTPLAPAIRGSIGVPHQGMITNAARLPKKGEGFALLRNNGVNWGNPRLVAAIEAAARERRARAARRGAARRRRSLGALGRAGQRASIAPHAAATPISSST